MDDLIDRILALDYVGPSPVCETCGKRKKPIGRDVPGQVDLCTYGSDGCDGYMEFPEPSQLHPGERASDFGYADYDCSAVTELICHARKLREGE